MGLKTKSSYNYSVEPTTSQRLTRSFFTRPVLEVAPELFGAFIVHQTPEQTLVAMITETEAYSGEGDLASHTARGRTPRNFAMFLPGGHFYVYRSYGIHWCVNVVTGQEGEGQGTLIRSILPIQGTQILLHRRGKEVFTPKIFQGPGNVAQAIGITREQNALDLTTHPNWWIQPRQSIPEILQTPRIGITKDKDLPWRWVLPDPVY
jgi:DNA-3-methyladenine glycosylase